MNTSDRGRRLARRMLTVAAAALIPALAGCGIGTNAQTQQWHQPTDGSTAVSGPISVYDAFVLGAPLDSALAPGQSAGLFLAIVNHGAPDRLTRILTPKDDGRNLPQTATSVTLPGGQVGVGSTPVLLTGPQPSVILVGLRRPLVGGDTVKIVLEFEHAAAISMEVPVMPRTDSYQTFSPAPSASPSASPTASGSPSARPKGKAKRIAKSSPSASASPAG